ncbi:hypothetical protein RHEph02_gp051 [Rhizobium phage RHEph02]|uniref:Uncharacterized protein n=1 Tax=Rhizobium phage RHEph02 TaxID=1220602 RepID=L7TJD6_9CAUD|nr:hypothetical protein HOS21_gp51 [Rhizobium phage RHEph02]AGC35618.1 hypothetical protein RHEph02_gp051 [Rhizobium phage RHEph02]
MSIVYVRFNDGKIIELVAAAEQPGPEYLSLDINDPRVAKYMSDPTGLLDAFKPLTPIRLELGMLYLNLVPDQVAAAIDALPEPDRTIAKIYWNRTEWFKRDDPILARVSAVFGLTEQQIDEAWKYAEQLT